MYTTVSRAKAHREALRRLQEKQVAENRDVLQLLHRGSSPRRDDAMRDTVNLLRCSGFDMPSRTSFGATEDMDDDLGDADDFDWADDDAAAPSTGIDDVDMTL